jgi:hypothetical protein
MKIICVSRQRTIRRLQNEIPIDKIKPRAPHSVENLLDRSEPRNSPTLKTPLLLSTHFCRCKATMGIAMQLSSPPSTAVATLPPRGKSAETFPLIRGGGVFLAATHPPRKSQCLPHEKTRRSFAFGSSQRYRMTLMFGAAGFWRPAISASRSFRFRITPRGIRAGSRRTMRHKCFKQRWIFDSARLRVASCGASA